MSFQPPEGSSLENAALGDLIQLPNGKTYTLRAHISLPIPVSGIQTFQLLGELELALALPTTIKNPALIYIASSHLPVDPSRCRVVVEGTTRYWAPHLPANGGAMGEISYRVLEAQGIIDPILVVYRSKEMIVFVRSSQIWTKDIKHIQMEKPLSDADPVKRHSGKVKKPAWVPEKIPQPVKEDTTA